MTDRSTQGQDSGNDLRGERRLQRRGRIIAGSLVALVSLPMLLAYILYHTGIGIPQGSVNEGDLLSPPQAFADWQPTRLNGESWSVDDQARKRWRWIIPVDRDCSGRCEDNLYLTRQVHVRLASEAYRAERIVLAVDGGLSEQRLAWLEEEHPGVEILRPDAAAMMNSLAQTNLSESPRSSGRYYLMDQEGFVMMSYSPDHSGGQLLDDIKRLLRYTYER